MSINLDRSFSFLAKSDGRDRVVKTLQYAGRFLHWYYGPTTVRGKSYGNLWRSAGECRKLLRLFKAVLCIRNIEKIQHRHWLLRWLATIECLGNAAYFGFDHFTYASKIGLIRWPASKPAYWSALGESIAYLCAVALDGYALSMGLAEERRLCRQMRSIKARSAREKTSSHTNGYCNGTSNGTSNGFANGHAHETTTEGVTVAALTRQVAELRRKRVRLALNVAKNMADLQIAIPELGIKYRLNNHVFMTLCGLTSAFVGAFQVWEATPA